MTAQFFPFAFESVSMSLQFVATTLEGGAMSMQLAVCKLEVRRMLTPFVALELEIRRVLEQARAFTRESGHLQGQRFGSLLVFVALHSSIGRQYVAEYVRSLVERHADRVERLLRAVGTRRTVRYQRLERRMDRTDP